MTNPYGPVNETAAQIYADKLWLQGALLCNVTYGIHFTLFAICAYILVRQMSRSNYARQLGFLVYIVTVFILGTLLTVSSSAFTQLAFVDNRNFPGGPAVYEQLMSWIPVDELGNVALVLSSFFNDALLVSLPFLNILSPLALMDVQNRFGAARWFTGVAPVYFAMPP